MFLKDGEKGESFFGFGCFGWVFVGEVDVGEVVAELVVGVGWTSGE